MPQERLFSKTLANTNENSHKTLSKQQTCFRARRSGRGGTPMGALPTRHCFSMGLLAPFNNSLLNMLRSLSSRTAFPLVALGTGDESPQKLTKTTRKHSKHTGGAFSGLAPAWMAEIRHFPGRQLGLCSRRCSMLVSSLETSTYVSETGD